MSEVLRVPRPRGNGPVNKPSEGRAPFETRAILERAVALHQAGNLDESEALYLQALKLAPKCADAIQFLGVLAHQRGDNAKAVSLLTKALKIEPGNTSCHNNLGNVYCAMDDEKKAAFHFAKAAGGGMPSVEALSNLAILRRRGGNARGARELLFQARSLDPKSKTVLAELAGLELNLRNYPEAEEAYKAYVALVPDDLAALNNLAYAVQQQGRYGEAEKLYEKILDASGNMPEFGYNARVNMIIQGRADEAEKHLRAELENAPDLWVAEAGLAVNLAARGHADRAVEYLRMILKALPDHVEAWTDIGLAFINMKKLEEGIEILRHAIELDPNNATAHNAIGCAYTLSNYPPLAVAAFKAANKARPDFIEPYVNLCRALRANGEYDQAGVYGHLALNHPNYKQSSSPNLIQLFRAICDFDGLEKVGDIWDIADRLPDDYLPALFLDMLVSAEGEKELERFVGLVRRWAEAKERRTTMFPAVAAATGSGSGKLRIGFLSSDLRTHSVSRFLTPLLRGFDKSRFEFYCYTSVRMLGDPLQEMFKEAVDRFTFVDNKGVWEISETIRGDKVDILFDLNGFTEGTMVDALVFNPAPVQISWLGYPFTLGLKAIDHVVLDRHVAPENGKYLTEEPILMPDAWVCFGKFGNVPIEDGLPMDRHGRVTFGTLNNPYKYTPRMIANWARVMRQVPDSRFLIVRPEARSHTLCRNVAQEFAKHGIGSDRLFLFDNATQRQSHLSYYNEIDVSLDTFPLTGGTTTCEAIWMGVPVVSLVGEAFHQRISYSALMQCGLEELCTFDDETFVRRAVEIADDRAKLVNWRHGLREAMSASPLCDHDRFIFQFQEMLVQVARHHRLR